MAAQKTILALTHPANASLATSQFRFGVKGTNGKISLAGAGVTVDGVIQNAPTAADLGVELAQIGTSKVVVNGGGTPIVLGDFLKSDAEGRGIKAASGDICGARAYEASTGINDIIEAFLLPPGFKMP